MHTSKWRSFYAVGTIVIQPIWNSIFSYFHQLSIRSIQFSLFHLNLGCSVNIMTNSFSLTFPKLIGSTKNLDNFSPCHFQDLNCKLIETTQFSPHSFWRNTSDVNEESVCENATYPFYIWIGRPASGLKQCPSLRICNPN